MTSLQNSEKILKIRQKIKLRNEEEEKKVLIKLGNLNQNIENSRVIKNQIKREELIKETVEKINEHRKLKLIRLQEEQKKEEEKALNKEKELIGKEKIREKVIEQNKYWINQQSMYLNEVNFLKKSDQQQNYMKHQENKMRMKERILDKHKKQDQIRIKLKETQDKIKKIKAGVDSEILVQKEKNLLSIKESLASFEKKNKKPCLDPTFMLTEPE